MQPEPVILHTKRLVLRPWNLEDLEPLIKLYADPRVMEYGEIKSREEAIKDYHHFVSSMKENGWGFWAVEVKDLHPFIGLIGLEEIGFKAHFTPAVEVGWRLHHAFWGKGYATEGALASLEYGFNTLLLDEIVSFTAPANERSRRVMERLGMTHDPRNDFDDPDLPEGHPIRRQVLYRLTRREWQQIHFKRG